MKTEYVVVAAAAALPLILALLSGCKAKPQLAPPPPTPPPATVDDLHFPVAVLYSTVATIPYKDAKDLSVMYMNVVLQQDHAPLLIDSQFNIFVMRHLQSTHGGLWMMAHPSGGTEVKFDLERAPSGLQAAREAMRAQLDLQTWRHDLDKQRATLAKQMTLKGMLKVVEAED